MTRLMHTNRLTTLLAVIVTSLGCSASGPPMLSAIDDDFAAQAGTKEAAPVILSFPGDSPGPPVYADISGGFMNTDGEWVAIELIRQRSCIPADFNLLQFADFENVARAFACPLTMQGREWWYAEDLAMAGPWGTLPPDLRTPFQARFEQRGDFVPIYFVRTEELRNLMNDRPTDANSGPALFISDLEELPSLRIGLATKYQMIQHNSNLGNAPGHSETVASGTLLGGGTFEYKKTDRGNVTLSITIAFRGLN